MFLGNNGVKATLGRNLSVEFVNFITTIFNRTARNSGKSYRSLVHQLPKEEVNEILQKEPYPAGNKAAHTLSLDLGVSRDVPPLRGTIFDLPITLKRNVEEMKYSGYPLIPGE